ncbi:MAG: LD-carboxypeptidase [Candidatus Hinthialibacter antarcticus]|nr:LD-carboxypeptidase [Candidatus Hinthialibacter antarcticus]
MKISRRKFVAAGAPLLAMTQVSCQSITQRKSAMTSMKPKAIQPGDTIGLICPASPIEPERVERAAELLKQRGYKVRLGNYLTEEYLCELSGTDEQRLSDLNGMIQDSGIDAVFTLRGGYGCNRLLDRIDYAALRADPKWLTGFSDITALHIAMYQMTGVSTLHGPAFGYTFGGESPAHDFVVNDFWDAVEGRTGPGPMRFTRDPSWSSIDTLQTVVSGRAQGRLVGGNLSRLASMAGTPWMLQGDEDYILFIEDVDEAAYRIDRYINQLRDSGIFERAKGLVIGQFYPREEDVEEETPLLANVLRSESEAIGLPTLVGAPIGHHAYNSSLAHGALVELDADAKSISYLEPITA